MDCAVVGAGSLSRNSLALEGASHRRLPVTVFTVVKEVGGMGTTGRGQRVIWIYTVESTGRSRFRLAGLGNIPAVVDQAQELLLSVVISFRCFPLESPSPLTHSLLPCLLRTPRFLQASPRPREGAPLYRSEDSWSCCRGFKVSYDFFFFIFSLTKKNWIFGALFTFFLCFSSVWSHYVLLFPSGSRDGFVLPSRCYVFRCHSLVVCCSLCLPYWFMEI